MPQQSGSGSFSRGIRQRQRLMYMIPARVDGTGTAAMLSGGQEITLTDNGTGDYTLTYAISFGQVPVVVATTKTTNIVLEVSASSVTACTILAKQAADGTTATDADFDVIIMGSYASDAV